MGYSKNNWLNNSGVVKITGGYEIPLRGAVITIGSTLDNLSFEHFPDRNIRIMGEFLVVVNGEILRSEYMNQKKFNELGEHISGNRIDLITFTRKMQLTIEIDGNPKVSIVVETDNVSYPIEKWEYNYKTGYIVGS